MVLVGRISKDAVINQLKDERKVVNFSIAVNDYYKPKNANEGVQIATYYNCAYWISTKVAERLLKGNLVELEGRVYVTAYTALNGEAKASLHCHVNSIKIHRQNKRNRQESKDRRGNRRLAILII
jgi:single-strand DNA-binding protein